MFIIPRFTQLIIRLKYPNCLSWHSFRLLWEHRQVVLYQDSLPCATSLLIEEVCLSLLLVNQKNMLDVKVGPVLVKCLISYGMIGMKHCKHGYLGLHMHARHVCCLLL